MNDKVMQFIEMELTKDPGVTNATLFAGAKIIDKTIGELNPRQFHAKYPLQVKRRLGAGASKPAARAPAPAKAASAASVASGDDAGATVLAYVTRRLKENPGVANAELFAGACEIDASVAELSPRQFHAKYPLQVKRRLSMAAAPAPKAAPVPKAAPAPKAAAAPKAKPAPKPKPAPAPAPAAEAPSMGAGDAPAVRALLINLARDLANAETQAETIEVMASLDAYVADIMQAARS